MWDIVVKMSITQGYCTCRYMYDRQVGFLCSGRHGIRDENILPVCSLIPGCIWLLVYKTLCAVLLHLALS